MDLLFTNTRDAPSRRKVAICLQIFGEIQKQAVVIRYLSRITCRWYLFYLLAPFHRLNPAVN